MEFKPTVNNSETKRYSKWVNDITTANRAPYLKTLRIHFPLNESNAADIDKWVKFALSKKVRNLELNMSNILGGCVGREPYIFRRDILLIRGAYNVHLTTLKSLHLESLALDVPVLENVLASCLNLERLTVRKCMYYRAVFRPCYCYKKQRLVISSLKLKHLDIFYCHAIELLEISAPKLTSFLFFGSPTRKVEYTSVPSLVNVTFGGLYWYYIFHNLHLLSNILSRLEKLTLHWSREFDRLDGYPLVDYPLSLITLIEACPMSHTFKLELWPLTQQAVPMSAQQDVKINYATRGHQHLKVLETVGFDGSVSVAEFAFFLTQNAPMLKKIICDPRCPQGMGLMHKWFDIGYIDRIAPARRLAKLLAKQVQGVDVVVL